MFCSGLCPSVRASCPCCGMASLSLPGTNGQLVDTNKVKDLPVRRRRTATASSRAAESGDEGYSESVMFWNASKSGLERLTTIERLTTSTAMLEFQNLTPAAEKKAEKLYLRLRMRPTGLQLRVQFLSLSLSLSLFLSRTRSIS